MYVFLINTRTQQSFCYPHSSCINFVSAIACPSGGARVANARGAAPGWGSNPQIVFVFLFGILFCRARQNPLGFGDGRRERNGAGMR